MAAPVLRIYFAHALVREVALDGPVTLGRDADNSVVLDDDAVSAHHGRVAFDQGAWVYTDVGSRNGSLVAAGPTLHAGEGVVLDDLVQVKLGDTVLAFQPGDPPAATGAAGVRPPSAPARPPPSSPPTLSSTRRIGDPGEESADARRVDGRTLRPRLVVVRDGETFTAPVSVPVARLGRAPDCDVVVDAPSISARHAEIRWDGRQFSIQDLGSTNGTRLSLARLRRPTPLPNGSHLILGDVDLLFVHDPAGGSLDGERVTLEPEGFLRWLRERRKLSREQAQAALARCRSSRRGLEEVLVADGYLSPGAVTELRHNAARRQLHRAAAAASPRTTGRRVALALIVAAVAAALVWYALT